MSENDITLWDTVVAIEFASECHKRAEENAWSCFWEAASNWQTAADIITTLDGEKDDLEAEVHTLRQAAIERIGKIETVATGLLAAEARVYELEQILAGRS
jgi:hypothetical protein